MISLELAALRKRARAAGIPRGIVARAQRLKEAHQAQYRPSCQTGLREPSQPALIDPVTIQFEGVSRWVVAVCRPSMALSVSQDLNLIGFRAYCPLGRKTVYRGRARKRRIQQSAVFGRYIFVGELLEPLTADVHDGIVDIIGDSQGAWALNPSSVQAINEAELAGQWDTSRVRPWEANFKRGQRVKVVEGHALAGFTCIVEECRRSGVQISTDLFGRPTTALIPAHKLVAAEVV